jgi:hypothetical protein
MMFLWVVYLLVTLFCVADCHFLMGYTYAQALVPFVERSNLSTHSVQVRLAALWKREVLASYTGLQIILYFSILLYYMN